MKIYCSDNTLKVSDIYEDLLGKDLWVFAYRKDLPHEEYLCADYLHFTGVTDKPTCSGLEEALQYNYIADYDVRRNTGLNHIVGLTQTYIKTLSSLDRLYDVVMPLEIYSTEDLLDLIAEEPDDEGEDW